MANIGVARASIYADLSATKYEKEAIKATERIAQTRTKSSAGDRVSFSTMEDTLRLDIAAKSGAIRSMASAQGHLTATMNALDSGNYILKQLHDLAVLAADETKTSEELAEDMNRILDKVIPVIDQVEQKFIENKKELIKLKDI